MKIFLIFFLIYELIVFYGQFWAWQRRREIKKIFSATRVALDTAKRLHLANQNKI